MDNSVALIEKADRMLATAKDLPDILEIKDMAQAAAEYARAARLGLSAQNKAAEIKLKAERKAGELLSGLERNQGKRNDTLSEPVQSKYVQAYESAGATRQDANRYQKVASIPDDIFLEFVEKTKADGEELTTNKALKVAAKIPDMTSVNGRDLSSLMSSASNEWYTTPDIIDAVTTVMGKIDLDPCSNSHDSPNVPANHHYTQDDDGLSLDWFGHVYMNPPYGNEIPKWVEKVVSEYENGNMTQAVLLLPSRTDTRWFRRLKPYPRCFMHGRVRFNNHENSAPFPTMLVNIGCDESRFIEVMENLGDIYYAV